MGWKITFDGTRKDLTPSERAKELEADPFASIWEGGKVVDLDELSPDVFDAIASDENSAWWNVYIQPGASGARLYAIACAAAEHGGVEKPSKPANMLEARLLVDMIEPTQDIDDKPIVNGFPPKPPETVTGSSSGPSNDSGGDLPKPEKKP